MMKRLGVLFLFGVFVCMAPTAAMAVEFQVPGTNTNLNVGGYVKLDVIYNDVSAGDDSSANYAYEPGSVPVGSTDGEENELIMNARESRLWVKTSTPTELGPIKSHLEFDFDTSESSQLVSNSRHGRIRHAYGTLDNWLFGTTWSLFMHLDSLPEINDFGGPTGSIFNRQPQIRYTMPLNDTSAIAFGVENPETYSDQGAVDDGLLPDIIVRYNMNPTWGNLSGAAMIRQLVVDNATVDDSTFTFSGQVGAVLKLGPSDSIKGALSFGDGLGRYSSLASHFDAVITAANDVDAVQQLAGFGGYEHIWGGVQNWRSNLVLGYSKADDPPILQGTAMTEETMSLHANLFMDPVPGARLGIEYIYGTRETYAGDDGDLNRLQFSAMYVF
jgi:hypothetical protein